MRGMLQRCYYAKHKAFHRYGGRGITICDEWRANFRAFECWAWANGYADNLTLDRIDNDGHYSPENCRWASRAAQTHNSSLVKFDRQTADLIRARYAAGSGTMRSLAEEFGLRSPSAVHRIIHNESWINE